MDYSTNFQNVSVVRETRRRNCATNGCQQMRVFCPTTVLRGSLSQVRSAWWFKVPSNNYLQKYDTNNLKGPFRTFSTRDGTATKCGAWFDSLSLCWLFIFKVTEPSSTGNFPQQSNSKSVSCLYWYQTKFTHLSGYQICWFINPISWEESHRLIDLKFCWPSA